jgi:hypothetical protein
MDDPLKKLADLSIKGKPGAPRFDPGQLMYTEINNHYVTFCLRTHALAVTIDDLTAEEAGLAHLYYRDPARRLSNEKDTDDNKGPKTADTSARQKNRLRAIIWLIRIARWTTGRTTTWITDCPMPLFTRHPGT